MNDERPETDDRDPAEVVTNAVGRILALAQTWTLWNGQLRTVDDRAYTPHKAIRRVADHLIDHLAQVVSPELQADLWIMKRLRPKANSQRARQHAAGGGNDLHEAARARRAVGAGVEGRPDGPATGS